MKTTSTALAALLVAAIGSTAIVPAATAQETAPAGATATVQEVHHRHDRMMRRDGGPDRLINFVCSPDGAEALEVVLVRLSYRLDLTAEQQPLFDALRTTALTAQTDFADTCAAAMPAEGETPDMIDMVKNRVAIDTARLEAINAILPDLEALYDSLSDEQKAGIFPERRGDRMIQREFRDQAPGRSERPAAPGRSERPAAPGR
jgi:hypothetical protein